MAAPREVDVRRRRLAAAFDRVEMLKDLKDPAELRAEYARHLCVLVCGFLEKSVAEIIVAYASGKTPRPLLSFVENSVRRLGNLDKEKLLAVVGSLDASWRNELDKFVIDEKKEALNSVVGLRHDIAHGGDGRVSLDQMRHYWTSIQSIVEKVAEVVSSTPAASHRSRRRRAR